MKVFTFTKDELKRDAVSLGYVPCVEEFFKALCLEESVTVSFKDDRTTAADALGTLQETLHQSWCGHADDLNEFLEMRARSLADAPKIRSYGFRSKESVGGVTTVMETADYYAYGTESHEFRIADGMVFDMEGDIAELFGNNKMF